MSIFEAIILGIIEGVTEFLPVSSTGHLTLAEKLMGMSLDDPSVTAFTAIIQIGAIIAAILYFRKDIWRVLTAWTNGIFRGKKFRQSFDYRYGWAIILGSLPIAVVGLAFKDEVETVLRSLWFVVFGFIGWSAVMWLADRYGKARHSEKDTTWRDTLIIGAAQCISLVPGVSRSGATISAGLLRGFDRVSVTKLSFFLGIPALSAAGILQAITQYQHIDDGVGWTATIVATVASFIVGYISIAWLLKFVAHNDFSIFIWYRLGLGVIIMSLLVSGTITAV